MDGLKPTAFDILRASFPRGRGAPGRWGKLLVGLMLFGLAIALMIESHLGLGPWDAFHVGIHRLTGMSVGMASIVVGIVIVVGTWFMDVRPGTGTLANMVLIGVFIDLFLLIVPPAPNWIWGLGYYAIGIGFCGFATGLYIAARMGKGPRDGLMIVASERMSWPVGRVRTGIEVTVLAAGFAMGGTIGIGTVLFAVAIGPATQWGLQWFGVAPVMEHAAPGSQHAATTA